MPARTPGTAFVMRLIHLKLGMIDAVPRKAKDYT